VELLLLLIDLTLLVKALGSPINLGLVSCNCLEKFLSSRVLILTWKSTLNSGKISITVLMLLVMCMFGLESGKTNLEFYRKLLSFAFSDLIRSL
jgi:hypothetical protein